MSASASKKKRKTQDQEGLNYKELEAKKASEEKKLRTKKILTVVLAVAAVIGIIIGVIALINAPYRQTAATVGSERVTVPIYNCFYTENANSMFNSYYAYGLVQANVPFSQQSFGDGTLEEYLISYTNSNIEAVYNMYAAAKADGYKLSSDGKKQIDQRIKDMKKQAQDYGYTSVNKFLKASYGTGVRIEDYRQYLTVVLTASEYQTHLQDTFNPTAEELDQAYNEDPAAYDYVLYASVRSNAEGQTDEESGETTYTDEARAAAKQEAEEKKADFPMDVTASRVRKSNVANEEMAAWLFDSARKAGDTEVFQADEDGNVYVTVRFDSRETNDYQRVSAYIIPISREAAQTPAGTADAAEPAGTADAAEPAGTADAAEPAGQETDAQQPEETAAENTEETAEENTEEAAPVDTEENAEENPEEAAPVDTPEDKLAALTEGLTAEMTDEEFEAYAAELNYTATATFYENYGQDQAILDYLFDESRKNGDYTVITTDSTYYLVRFAALEELTNRERLVKETQLNEKLESIATANSIKMIEKALKYADTDKNYRVSSSAS